MNIIKDYNFELPVLNNNGKVFEQYVKDNFDLSINRIERKLFHTFRVVNFCTLIGKQLGLDENLCYNIGLLHDYARFKQWTLHQSFNDKYFEHADEAVKMLFEEGDIKKFDIDEDDYFLINMAIKFHNKIKIDLNYIQSEYKKQNCKYSFKDILTYCKLIRDCDKLDIFNQIAKGEMTLNYLTDNGFNPAVLKSVKNHTSVNTSQIKTKLDRVLCFIAFLFDIYFPQTLNIMDLDRYFLAVDKHYGSLLNSDDRQILNKVIKEVKPSISVVA